MDRCWAAFRLYMMDLACGKQAASSMPPRVSTRPDKQLSPLPSPLPRDRQSAPGPWMPIGLSVMESTLWAGLLHSNSSDSAVGRWLTPPENGAVM